MSAESMSTGIETTSGSEYMPPVNLISYMAVRQVVEFSDLAGTDQIPFGD